MNIPEEQIAKMVRNIMIDFVLGLVPFFGDIFDFIYKANSKNLSILESYSKKKVINGEIIESKSA